MVRLEEHAVLVKSALKMQELIFCRTNEAVEKSNNTKFQIAEHIENLKTTQFPH